MPRAMHYTDCGRIGGGFPHPVSAHHTFDEDYKVWRVITSIGPQWRASGYCSCGHHFLSEIHREVVDAMEEVENKHWTHQEGAE